MGFGDIWQSIGDFFGSSGNGGGGGSSFASIGADSPNPHMDIGSGVQNTGGWGDIGREVVRSAVPNLAAAGVGMAARALFPGEPGKIVNADLRTGTGRAAEDLRLGGAQTANRELQKSLKDPYYGTLSEEDRQEEIRKMKQSVRAGAAARGILESGVSLEQERRGLADLRVHWAQERNKAINDRFGQLSANTGGFTPQWSHRVEGEKNPWGEMITGAVAPAVKAGTQTAVNKWMV